MTSLFHQFKKLFAGTGDRSVRYAEKGRDGYIVYKDEYGQINFYFEFGGGDCVAVISIPSVAKWKKETGRPVEQREDIIQFTAQQVIKDKTPGCNYKVNDNWIEFFKK